MKVLGLATGLVFACIAIILVWAISSGTPLSGEPTASMQINNSKRLKTADFGQDRLRDKKTTRTGQTQVVLDVTPGVATGKRVNHSRSSPTNGGLLEPSKYGLLPKRGKNGRNPATAYARRYVVAVDTRPRIAILFTGLGLNKRLSKQALKNLPPKISLSFSPYSRHLDQLLREAGRQGHEMMLEIPMEPLDYPESDAGPKSLLVGRSVEDNRSHLLWALGRFTGYFGVVNAKGGRYLANKKAAGAFFEELQHRGLYFFRDQAVRGSLLANMAQKIGLGYKQASLEVDRNPSKQGINRALQKLEATARRTGLSVGVARMHPVSIRMISQWANKLKNRGFQLIPVSSTYFKTRGRS